MQKPAPSTVIWCIADIDAALDLEEFITQA